MPVVSIVTATYNRSNVLKHALASVRRQTHTDWELLVIGDGCTDDTAAVVGSFGDPRIHFENLPNNHGEQSVPNNRGAALAQGEYLAFLNHDDLWFSDHLQTLLAALERGGADLVYGLSARIDAADRIHLWGDSPGGVYQPWQPVPATQWLMRRALFEQVGPWTSARELWDSPSQDWLRRAARMGATLRPVSRLTAVQITSGGRRNSYAERAEDAHQRWVAAMDNEVVCREQLLTMIAAGSSAMATATRPLLEGARALRALVTRGCAAIGLPPTVLFNAVRFGRKGGFIRSLRKMRGLTPAIGDRR